jgi:hypothetical protein
VDAFLSRFYEEVADNLADPYTSVRLTTDKMLRDLHAADRDVFEQLLKATLQESNLGFAEATISFAADQEYYILPPGFRKFLRLFRTQSGVITDAIGSKSHYQGRYAIEILTGDRGFRIKPAMLEAADWTMYYSRAPGQLHYAKAERVTETSLVCGTPPADGGEVVTLDDYYNGMEVRVFKAGLGVLQTRVIKNSKVVDGKMVLFLRNSWIPRPEGEVWYELCPTLPPPYDSIYALDVALLNMGRRSRPERAQELLLQRAKKWDSAKSVIQSNVADRPPERTLPQRGADRMSSEIPYPFMGN